MFAAVPDWTGKPNVADAVCCGCPLFLFGLAVLALVWLGTVLSRPRRRGRK
jgi:hypothetical protein